MTTNPGESRTASDWGKTYPLIEAQATKEDAEVFWADEAGVAADKHPRFGSARKGQRATLQVPDSHFRINAVGGQQRGGAAVHDLPGDDDRRLAPRVPGPVAADDPEGPPDRGPSGGARGGGGGRV